MQSRRSRSKGQLQSSAEESLGSSLRYTGQSSLHKQARTRGSRKPKQLSHVSESEEEGSVYASSRSASSSEENSEDEDGSGSQSSSDETSVDEEYEQFIKQYGHVDFLHLGFLPRVRARQHFRCDSEAEMRQQALIESKIAKNNKLINRQNPKQSSFRMESILEEDDEENSMTVNSGRPSQLSQRLKYRPSANTVKANRFDFRFNNRYRIDNVFVDPKGERFRSASTAQTRIVSRVPMQLLKQNFN